MPKYNLDLDELDKSTKGKKLTVGEAIERLKKNPNDPDPEIQEFKKSLEGLYEQFVPVAQEMAQIITEAQQSHFVEMIRSIKPTVELYSTAFASIQSDMVDISKGFAESLAKMQADVVRLSLPTKAIIESIASWQAPLIYPVLSQDDDVELIQSTEKENKEKEPLHTKTLAEEVIEERNTMVAHIDRFKEKEPEVKRGFFAFDEETGSFAMKQTKLVAFNVNSQRGRNEMNIFFSTLLEMLDEGGQVVGQFLQVPVPLTELLRRLKAKNLHDVTRNWIKSAKSNLIHKKIMPAKGKKCVVLSDFDDEIDGFYFKLMLPLDFEM